MLRNQLLFHNPNALKSQAIEKWSLRFGVVIQGVNQIDIGRALLRFAASEHACLRAHHHFGGNSEVWPNSLASLTSLGTFAVTNPSRVLHTPMTFPVKMADPTAACAGGFSVLKKPPVTAKYASVG